MFRFVPGEFPFALALARGRGLGSGSLDAALAFVSRVPSQPSKTPSRNQWLRDCWFGALNPRVLWKMGTHPKSPNQSKPTRGKR